MELVGIDVPHFDVGSVPSSFETDIGNILYVTNTGGGTKNGTISVINVDTTKLSAIPVEKLPRKTVPDLNKDALYVPNTGSNTVSVIDRSNPKLIKEIPIESPEDMTYDASANRLYVSSTFSDTITVLNYTDIHILKIITVRGASELHLNPYNSLPYVLTRTVFDSNGAAKSIPSVTVVNSTDYNIVEEIPFRGEPSDMYIDLSEAFVFEVSSDMGTNAGFVTVINGIGFGIIEEIRVGNSRKDISFTSEYVRIRAGQEKSFMKNLLCS